MIKIHMFFVIKGVIMWEEVVICCRFESTT